MNNLMIMQKLLAAMALVFSLTLTAAEPSSVRYLNQAPIIDGSMDEVWHSLRWRPLDQIILGERPKKNDLHIRYKLGWREEGLYLLAEITDDKLVDMHPNPLDHYWDDDCLEIFVDENASGGIHTNNFNAFAYHLGLDNQVVDIAPVNPADDAQGIPWLFNDHVENAWRRTTSAPWSVIWEAKVRIYDDRFDPRQSHQTQAKSLQTLVANKKMGFMLAYCDNDGGEQREHFIGSWPIDAVNGDSNRGYIDAGVFQPVRLVNQVL